MGKMRKDPENLVHIDDVERHRIFTTYLEFEAKETGDHCQNIKRVVVGPDRFTIKDWIRRNPLQSTGSLAGCSSGGIAGIVQLDAQGRALDDNPEAQWVQVTDFVEHHGPGGILEKLPTRLSFAKARDRLREEDQRAWETQIGECEAEEERAKKSGRPA